MASPRPSRLLRYSGPLVVLAAPFMACAASSGHASGDLFGDDGGNDGSVAASTGSPGSSGGAGSSGGMMFGTTSGGGSKTDAGHGQRCDDAGNCSCIAVASLGHEGVWGPCSSDTTTAFQSWLDSQSTATVDAYDTTKPALTADFLGKYDVLILQWMVASGVKYTDGDPWVFSSDEVKALQTWVQGGGGLIVLSGYQCNGVGCPIEDVVASNQLLSFTDFQFNADDVLDPGATSCGSDNCYCWGGSFPLGAPQTTPSLPLTAGAWQGSVLGYHVTDIGAYVARSIRVSLGTGGTGAAGSNLGIDASDGAHVYAAHEQIGLGHVVIYGDEWLTYSGEWTGTDGTCLNFAYDSGYDPCYGKSPPQVFQIPQFWYNAIKYAGSAVQCTFKINTPGIVY